MSSQILLLEVRKNCSGIMMAIPRKQNQGKPGGCCRPLYRPLGRAEWDLGGYELTCSESFFHMPRSIWSVAITTGNEKWKDHFQNIITCNIQLSENNNITMAESRNVTQCKSIVIMFISILGDIMSENNDITPSDIPITTHWPRSGLQPVGSGGKIFYPKFGY